MVYSPLMGVHPHRRRAGARAALIAAALLGSAPAARAAEPRIDTPSAGEVERTLPAGESLTGKEIYDRFLRNRRKLRTARQEGRILSRDPGGNPQETRFELRAKDYRDADEQPVDGIYSKTVIQLMGPYEIRWSGYLYVHRADRADDQYSYAPSRRRVSRISLKGQSLAGTDFSFDDFLVSVDDIEDADYERRPDEVFQGVAVYVVEATMKPDARSRYTRTISYVEKEHYVPLRTRYFDRGVEVKDLVSPHEKIKDFDGAWVPTESRMTDILEGTSSTMHLDRLDPNPTFDDHDFNLSVLLEQRS